MTTLTTTIASAKPSDFILISKNNQLVTDSRYVAQYFGKQHKDVLRKLENLDCSNEFTERNFTLCYKNNELQNGKPQPFYQMTKNGFIFLVMGFTGKRAAEIKERYIQAFDEMQAKLKHTLDPFERNRMMFTWEGGKLVSVTPLDNDHIITKREQLALIIREPAYLSLEELIAINHSVNERITAIAEVAGLRVKR